MSSQKLKTLTGIILVALVTLFASAALTSGPASAQTQWWSPLPTPVAQPTVQFSNSTYSVGESAGVASITAYLNMASWQQVRVNYSTYAGTATPYSDYTPVNGTLTFDPGETSKTFTVPIINDSNNEASKTVNLALSNPVNVSLGVPSTAVLTIMDDDAPVPVPTTPPPSTILGHHTVRPGETLFCIARAYAVSPWAIASENNLAYPYSLYTNQVLAIPNVPWLNPSPGTVCQAQFGDAPVPPSPPPPPPYPGPGMCRYTHIVQYGDTLYAIARRYNTTVWAITNANHIMNPNYIFVGQRLCIP